MTCKDCIHSECCFIQYGKTEALKWQSELGCKNFKDRARFVKLTCKPGDTVYSYCEDLHEILEYTVEYAVVYRENTIHFNADAYDDKKDEALSEIDFTSEDFGKTVFITKKEAEAVLREKK